MEKKHSVKDFNIIDLMILLGVKPENAKIHLAVRSTTCPLDEYFAGTFEKWQSIQTRRNFERKWIISLIQTSANNVWMFAGIYESIGAQFDKSLDTYKYRTNLTNKAETLSGRLFVKFKRPGRASYLNAENYIHDIEIYEITPEKLKYPDFSSYRFVDLSWKNLETIISNEISSWKNALSCVSGIYLIADRKSGQMYVGSANGKDGLWGRWKDYVGTFHGGNQTFKKLLANKGTRPFLDFQFSILETHSLEISDPELINHENRWKERLMSRTFGFNEN